MTYETILYNVQDGVATIQFNRPDTYNAFNKMMLRETRKAFQQAERDPDVQVVVLTGEGKAFCSGADLTDISVGSSLLEDLRNVFNPLVASIYNHKKVVIGAINGVAAGAGLGIALACDLRIMSEKGSMVFAAFARIGLVPDSGMTYFLPRLVGASKALELMLFADGKNRISPEEAHNMGLVSRVADADNFMDSVQSFAKELAAMSTFASGLTKRLLHQSWDKNLHEMLEQEAQLQAVAGRHPDSAEGVKAFLEKRPPEFNQS